MCLHLRNDDRQRGHRKTTLRELVTADVRAPIGPGLLQCQPTSFRQRTPKVTKRASPPHGRQLLLAPTARLGGARRLSVASLRGGLPPRSPPQPPCPHRPRLAEGPLRSVTLTTRHPGILHRSGPGGVARRRTASSQQAGAQRLPSTTSRDTDHHSLRSVGPLGDDGQLPLHRDRSFRSPAH
jgi:hypothetical protein